MKEVLKYSKCFVCGDSNNHGLKAKFLFDGEKATTDIVASDCFEGYRGIYHGGIISALLDEVMIKAILAEEKYAVTVELTVRYLLPVRVGERVRFTGRVIKTKGRVTFTEGVAMGENDQVYATATGKYIEADPNMKNELMKSVG
ncbi:MAG: PaaI family thioesterase [Candidatus Zixiibacteriota bacterium]